MNLGSKGQLHVSRPIYVLIYLFRIIKQIFTSHCIYSEHTFCAKHVTFKVYFPNTYTIRYLLMMVRFKKDVIAWCLTHKSKCVIYLTVGDRCRSGFSIA